jgi:hypothetical protein
MDMTSVAEQVKRVNRSSSNLPSHLSMNPGDKACRLYPPHCLKIDVTKMDKLLVYVNILTPHMVLN